MSTLKLKIVFSVCRIEFFQCTINAAEKALIRQGSCVLDLILSLNVFEVICKIDRIMNMRYRTS